MSHRLSSNMNNQNLISYDVYNARIKRGPKMSATLNANQRVPTRNNNNARDNTKSKLTMQTYNQPAYRSRANSNPTRERNSAPQSINQFEAKQQKNVANNQNKPSSQSRAGSGNSNSETWAKILKSNTDDPRPFSNFDPLRTLHFLSKELQLKLIQKMPTDDGMLEMLDDMQHAISRIPPDLLSILAMQMNDDKSGFNSASATTTESEYVRSKTTSHKCVQTSKSLTLVASEELYKHMEENSVKIQAACAQMEAVCTKLKAEKLELEAALRKERDVVAKLSEQQTSQDVVNRAKEEELSKMIDHLAGEKRTLELEVKKLNAQLENQQTMANDDLKSLIHELRKKRSDAEREAMVARHQLTLTTMENDKIAAQMATRDRQIDEMRDEMKQLQEVVNEQLVELQNIRCSTDRSSVSTITDSNVWHQPEKEEIEEDKDEAHGAKIEAEDETLVARKSSSECKVTISGESSTTSAALKHVSDYDIMNHMYLTKDFEEIDGEPQRYKSSTPKIPKDYMLGSTTTTTATVPYDGLLHDPIKISNLIQDVKNQALSIAAGPMQQRRD